MSFDLSPEGTVTQVYFPPHEDPEVLNQKKMLLGTLSAKLVMSQESLQNGSRWGYRVNETGQEGKGILNLAIFQF